MVRIRGKRSSISDVRRSHRCCLLYCIDFVGKGLSGGRIIVYPPPESPFKAEEVCSVIGTALRCLSDLSDMYFVRTLLLVTFACMVRRADKPTSAEWPRSALPSAILVPLLLSKALATVLVNI